MIQLYDAGNFMLLGIFSPQMISFFEHGPRYICIDNIECNDSCFTKMLQVCNTNKIEIMHEFSTFVKIPKLNDEIRFNLMSNIVKVLSNNETLSKESYISDFLKDFKIHITSKMKRIKTAVSFIEPLIEDFDENNYLAIDAIKFSDLNDLYLEWCDINKVDMKYRANIKTFFKYMPKEWYKCKDTLDHNRYLFSLSELDTSEEIHKVNKHAHKNKEKQDNTSLIKDAENYYKSKGLSLDDVKNQRISQRLKQSNSNDNTIDE